jgi:hypothetical protein
MMAYSMSKTITATAVLQLVEAGKVGLDDPLERYVDSLPYGSSVTVRQLISHTSGIPNPIPLRWVHPAARHETFDENAALAAVLHDHPRLSFEPGTKYAYSNIGYWVLGTATHHAGDSHRDDPWVARRRPRRETLFLQGGRRRGISQHDARVSCVWNRHRHDDERDGLRRW